MGFPCRMCSRVFCCLLLYAFLCVPPRLLEGDVIAANAPRIEYLHQIWRPEEGLPGPTVKAIVQGRSGYLWLGTDEGLTRFDGNRFENLEKDVTGAKVERWLIGLTETRDGTIWASSSQGKLISIKDGQKSVFGHKDGLPYGGILCLHEDLRGDLWIGTGEGLFRYSQGKFFCHTNEPGLLEAPIRDIEEDKNGNLWFGTSKGLSRMRDGVFSSVPDDMLVNPAVMCLLDDRDGVLWVGTSSGLTRIVNNTPVHYTTRNGLAHNIVRDLLQDSSGRIWVATQGGIQIFENNQFISVDLHDDSPEFEGISFIYTLCEDHEGNIWAGSNLGISRLKPQKFQVYSKNEGLSHNLTTLVFEDRDATTWIGTYGGGICRILPDKIINYDSSSGLPSDFILSMWQDRAGWIWIGTDGAGLIRFQDGNFTQFVGSDLPVNTIRVIHEDKAGNLWLGSNAGAHRLKHGQFIREETVPRTVIKAITEQEDGTLWFGTKKGLAQWKEGNVRVFSTTNGLVAEGIAAIFEDSNKRVWVATEGGGIQLLKSDGTFSSPPPNFNERVLHILEDQHNLWLGTRSGIFCVTKRNLDNFAEGKTELLSFTSYGRKDGLRRAQCNGIAQPAGWRSRDGRIWFPTMHGAVVFDPERINLNRLPPPVVIEQISVDGQSFEGPSKAVFPPGRGLLEIQYTALSFQAPEKVQFKYQLEGFSREWEDAGTRRVARFANLAPGNYTFRVKACNNDGVWNEIPSSISFTLSPHFYQTYAFYSLCGVVLVTGGFGVHRFRISRIKRRELELAELVQKRTANLQEMIRSMENFNYSIAHDLRAPIRAIRGFTEALIEDYRPSLDSMGEEYAKRIEQSVDRMDRMIQDLLTYGHVSHKEIPTERVQLDMILARTLQTLNDDIVARKATIELRMPMSPVLANTTILEQVFTNLISNGIKFVKPGVVPRLEIWAEESTAKVKIFVRDNGIGISRQHYDRIFRIFERLHTGEVYPGTGIGLAIVHRGVERMGGKVGVESTENSGSCFWVELIKAK